MTSSTKKILSVAFIAIASIGMSACGKKKTDTAPSAPGIGAGWNGTGGWGGTGGYGNGACVPISQQIPFIANNLMINSIAIAGYAGQQIQLGGGGPGPWNGSSVDGNISMNIVPNGGGYQGGYIPQGSSGTGIVTISQATRQDIMYQLGMYGGYGQYGQYGEPCVSGVSINLTYNMGTYRLYGGYVTLMIAMPNGQQVGPYNMIF